MTDQETAVIAAAIRFVEAERRFDDVDCQECSVSDYKRANDYFINAWNALTKVVDDLTEAKKS